MLRCLLAWTLVLLLSSSTVAAEQTRPGPRAGQLSVGVAPCYAFIVLQNKAEPDGGGVLLFFDYGISDAVSVRLSGLWSGHDIEAAGKDPGGLFQVLNLALGVSYMVDLSPVRPAIEAGLGLLHQRYQDQTSTSVGLQAGLAVDYDIQPWLAVGAAFHYHAYLQNPSQYPVYFDFGPRVIFRTP